HPSLLNHGGPGHDAVSRGIYSGESARYVTDWEAGTSWLNAVAATTQQAFDSVKPQVGQGFTFTSGEGTIPILMGDPGLIPLRVTVELQSSQFDFPDGSQREV